LHFDNQPLDGEIGEVGGLYHLGARYYDPVTGRFLSADPISLTEIPTDGPQRYNRYAYGLNNPYRYEDPTGQAGEERNARRSLAVLAEMAGENPNVSPEARLGARWLYQRLARALEVLRATPSPAMTNEVKAALATVIEANGIVRGGQASQEFLELRLAKQARKLFGGKGGLIGAIIVGTLAAPSIAEAADKERYGSAVADVLNIIRPPDFIIPIPQVLDVDPETGQATVKDVLTWTGEAVDSLFADE
jgi:RHS repeat-associated protein